MRFSKLPPSRLQAALAGRVSDSHTQQVLSGVTVRIIQMPPGFQRTLAGLALMHGAAWDTLKERPDVALTRADGAFRFINLPDGPYTLQLSIPGAGRLYGTVRQDVTVTRDASGTVTTPFASLALDPTSIKGKVLQFVPPPSNGKPSSTAPLAMAEVRAQGSTERVFTNATGDFYLGNVEPGPRTLLVSAPGFQPGSMTVSVQVGLINAPSPLVLHP